MLLTDSLFSSHPCTVRTEDVSFRTPSFWLVCKLFLCFLPRSPNHSVSSMLTKTCSSYSCKTYLSGCKILKQTHVLHFNFHIQNFYFTVITHPILSCILLMFPLVYCFVKPHGYSHRRLIHKLIEAGITAFTHVTSLLK